MTISIVNEGHLILNADPEEWPLILPIYGAAASCVLYL
jgi:hypothetical protein